MLKALFIINPISGLGKQKNLPELIARYLDKSRFSYELRISEYAGHAKVIATEAREAYDVLVAVGGDGTINEVAGCLLHQKTALGVIPLGSGNGLGRHLSLSTDPVKALQQLNRARPTPFDAGMLNEKPFFNVSGTGFDAQISQKFAAQVKRGFITYSRCVLQEIQTYTPGRYQVQLGDRLLDDTYFLIAFANTAQYGNNAFIAPHARTDDGLLDLVLVKPFPLTYFPTFAWLALTKKLGGSPYVQIEKVSEAVIRNLDQTPVHLDGEYEGLADSIRLGVHAKVLQVMVPY